MLSIILIIGLSIGTYGDNELKKHIEKTMLPGMFYTVNAKEPVDWGKIGLNNMIPLYQYWSRNTQIATYIEDEDTYKKILALQEKDENHISEDLDSYHGKKENQQVKDLSLEKLKDFNYLISNFYTVDSSTSVGPEQFNAEKLLSKSMKIDQKADGPKVLIYHTHSQEAFADSKAGDSTTSIVGIGAYLSELLNAKGISTIHHTGVYDLINGKLDRSEAYQKAEEGITKILKENPSIEVVIDLHRDGVPENTHLVTNINGKETAKIMFFNGLSRTKSNGDISYLKNPYLQDNLSFSLQMQLMCEDLYPGFARRIYLRGYRYNLHLMPKTLLIEAGAQTNTVQEMKNAMELLANVLYKVLL